ncbi:response regulator transcription factor [Sphingobium nicotianae]|uniref:Response regulator transcription factor n=1 Tax=Sphingobium nicotianae TaxID=2782607 RepID=A0A9X1ISH0_9SPHN|nr:response regulator transcription factor [Sphingobium nicotianae]
MHFLIVEDDPVIAEHIVAGLRNRGHCTTLAQTGSEAIRSLDQRQPDAVILDRLLPDVNGLTVIGHLRSRGDQVPLLMLSALGSVKDRIEGLQVGADDYLAKPFDIDELEARLSAIARRTSARSDSAHLEVGRLRLDPSSHCAVYRDASVALNRKQYSLLAHLIRNADRLVTRSMLLESVWSYSFSPTTNIVESNMSRLRTALLDLGCDPIETQRGAGYVLRSERCT